MPRTFGYVFNPISVYYVRDANEPAYVVLRCRIRLGSKRPYTYILLIQKIHMKM